MLPPELVTQLRIPQLLPQDPFSIRWYATHLFRPMLQLRIQLTVDRIISCICWRIRHFSPLLRRGARGEVRKRKLHQSPFAPSDPIALRGLDAFAPIELVQSVEQPLCVGSYAQAPLRHAFPFHGMAAAFAHTVLHFVVGEHCAQCGAPVHPGFAEVGEAEILKGLLLFPIIEAFPFFRSERPDLFLDIAGEDRILRAFIALEFEMLDQRGDRFSLVLPRIVPAFEQLKEDPLRPLVE